jgi:hypothetical protein
MKGMKWAAWVYFENNWQDHPQTKELGKKRAAFEITPREYKSAIRLVKQAVLQKMLQEGRITEADLINPGPPPPTKPQKPNIGKRVPIGKAAPAHGRPHKPKAPWKYTSEVPGGLPGLGKK